VWVILVAIFMVIVRLIVLGMDLVALKFKKLRLWARYFAAPELFSRQLMKRQFVLLISN